MNIHFAAPMGICIFMLGCLTGLLLPFSAAARTADDVSVLRSARVVRFEGSEGLNELFAYDVELACSTSTISFSKVLGKSMSIALMPGRTVHGVVARIEQLEQTRAESVYRIRLVPRLAALAHTVRSRTFVEKKIPDIAMDILTAAGIPFENNLQESRASRSLMVQYEESDLQFFQRLLEEDGIIFYFTHDGSQEKVVLADDSTSLPLLAADSTLTFAPSSTDSRLTFRRGQSVTSRRVEAVSWNPVNGQVVVKSAGATSGSSLTRDIVPWPDSQGELQRQATGRLEQLQSAAEWNSGETSLGHLQSGHRFRLTGHFNPAVNGEYLLTRLRISGTPGAHVTSFDCVPASMKWRPARVTPRPFVGGVMIGRVTGPSGEAVYCDKWGRVKVDLPGFPDAGQTGGAGHLGWVPVAERAAGATVQTLSVPEVGETVLVAFDGGNPDRPVIAGRLFSGGEMPPLPLPEQKTTSVLANRGNEVVMDGKTGAELLRINGRGDVVLEGGRDLRIGTGEEIVVRGGQTIAIETGASIVLRAGNQSITISPEGITLTRTPQIVPSGTEKTAPPVLKRP